MYFEKDLLPVLFSVLSGFFCCLLCVVWRVRYNSRSRVYSTVNKACKALALMVLVVKGAPFLGRLNALILDPDHKEGTSE